MALMGSLSDEEDQFLDACEEIASVSDSDSECLESLDCCDRIVDPLPVGFEDDIWVKKPGSIHERRDKFLRWMGLGARERMQETVEVVPQNESDGVIEDGGTVSSSCSFDERLSSSQSSLSCCSTDAHEFLDGSSLEENLVYRFKNLDDGTEFVIDEFGQDGMVKMLREMGSNRLITVDEFERNLGLSTMVQRLMRRKVKEECSRWVARKQVKKGWLRKLSRSAFSVHGTVSTGNMISGKSYPVAASKNQTVKVRSYKKHTKEFSALYMGQDILAHEGSILTMKFSPDGQYLATAGEDGIVRVWQVMEMERSPELDMFDLDPSYAYFRINNLSEIVPLYTNKDKRRKFKTLRKSDSACVIFPHKVFRILEKPLHEFHGHSGDVLDLSWSKNKYLLSSSVDKTVRLWQVECDQCLKVFSHNDYVTCVDFHPLDDNYFISGSIDGKVRIWAISGCKVVDWTDIRQIVTAVCYNSDGKGAIVGSMTGNCRFYDASDNHLNLCSQICIRSKKKSPSKRIIGFQFCPSDPSKLMVTSADSKVRILDGVDMICKFQGSSSVGSQISASFTSSGMHVVSASEDSHVHVWNNIGQDGHVPKSKSKRSCERFFSNNASIAIPWCGMTRERSVMSGASASRNMSINFSRSSDEQGSLSSIGENLRQKLTLSSPEQSSVSPVSRGCATWPEEKLPPPSSLVVSSSVCKSQYKFLKAYCQSSFSSANMWGMVIVTAGWDGRIKCFQNYGLPIRL